jgi:hypothetical protein
VEGQGFDFLDELGLGASVDGGSQALDEGRVLLHGRVEGALHGEDICVGSKYARRLVGSSGASHLARRPRLAD